MNDNDLPKVDETSKADDDLNVTPDLPDTGKPTSSDNGSTEPSDADGSDGDGNNADDANVQAQIQKHAELRKKAEEEAEQLRKENEELRKAKEAADAEREREANRQKRDKVAALIKDAVEKSSLPKGYVQNRVGKDPVNWFLAHQSDLPEKMTWDEVMSLASDKISDLVSGLEKDLHVSPSTDPQTPQFTDPDNAPAQQQTPSSGALTMDDIKKMTPYEIANLPDEIKSQIAHAGEKLEL